MVRVQVLLSFLLMCAKQPREEGDAGMEEEEEEEEGQDEEEEEEEEVEEQIRVTSMMDGL